MLRDFDFLLLTFDLEQDRYYSNRSHDHSYQQGFLSLFVKGKELFHNQEFLGFRAFSLPAEPLPPVADTRLLRKSCSCNRKFTIRI